MAPLKISLLLAATCLQQVLASHDYFNLWWYMPTGAKITCLESTMTLPNVSPGQGIHFIWPGMEPSDGSFVFQNVLGDDISGNTRRASNTKPTEWTFATWDVPDKTGTEEYGIVGSLHPGDKIWSDFDLDTTNNQWSDPWTLEPGPAGQAAGRKKDSGGIKVTLPKDITLDLILFSLEIYDGAWDVGDLTFENILMESNTTDTKWCGPPSAQTGAFKYTMSNAVSNVVDGRSQCSIDKLVMHQP